MVPRDADKQRNRQDDGIGLTVSPIVHRLGEGVVGRPFVPQDMRLAGLSYGKFIETGDEVGREPRGLTRQDAPSSSASVTWLARASLRRMASCLSAGQASLPWSLDAHSWPASSA